MSMNTASQSTRNVLSCAVLSLLIFLMVVTCAAPAAFAQPKATVVGNYSGILGPLHLKLHLTVSPDGAIGGTLDSPDQGAFGLACDTFKLDGPALSFNVPSVHGSWKGSVSSDNATLNGTWSQGAAMPLNFTRDTDKQSAVDGTWLGTLHAGAISLRVQVNVHSDAVGNEHCTLDSLDQHATGIPCAKVILKANDFSFEVPDVHGSYSGKLSADNKTLNGTWTQGGPIELTMTRQATALSIPPPAMDAAIPPVTSADLQSVMERDLAQAIKSGRLAPATGGGLVIGIIDHGAKRIFAYGTAKPDSIFEIGSISKTFTGLLLSQMAQQGKVKLDEPVRELLPPGTVESLQAPRSPCSTSPPSTRDCLGCPITSTPPTRRILTPTTNPPTSMPSWQSKA